MRLAFISDIHGNLPALNAVVADIGAQRIEQIVNLGDILSGPLWPVETAERLIGLGLPTIAGNHERQVLTLPIERMSASDAFTARRLAPRHRDWLASLPPTRWIGDEVWCCHGTPGSDVQYWLETVSADAPLGVREATADEADERFAPERGTSASLLLCGHTHMPRLRRLPAGVLVLNPGSVGLPAYDDGDPIPHRIETGSPHARWASAERVDAGWRIALHAVPYAHEDAARQAERNGRPDWADSLRSGRVGCTEADALALASMRGTAGSLL